MGGGSDTTQTTQSQSVQQLPPWINQAAQQNYGFAQNVAQQPLQQYQGQMLADVAPQTQQSWNTAATGGSAGQDQYNAAQAGLLGVLGSTPQQLTAAQARLAPGLTAATGGNAATSGLAQSALAAPMSAATSGLSQLSGQNLSAYMNPYTQSVINNTLPLMQQQNALQQNQIQNAANSSNAFGGSRQGVQQGVAQAQGALNIGQMAAGLNQANFQQAQQAGEYDVTAANNMGQFNAGQTQAAALNNMNAANNMNQFNATAANNMGQFNAGARNNMAQFGATQQNQANAANMAAANQMGLANAGALNTAAQANQAAGLQQQNLGLQAASGLGALGNQAQLAQARNFTEQMTAGQMQQQQAQNQINAQMAKFQNAANYPNQQLSVLQSALGMTPYEQGQQGSSTTETQTAANPMQMALGGLSTLGSLFPGGQMAGLGGALGGMMHASKGETRVPGPLATSHIDSVPRLLAPGEAVLNREAADRLGRGKIKALNQTGLTKRFGSGGKMAVHPAIMGALAAPRGPAMGPPVSAMSMGGPRMPGPNLAAIAGARPPMGAMGPPVAAGAMGGPRMPGPNLGAIASGGLGPLAGPKPVRPRRMRMPQLRGALAGG